MGVGGKGGGSTPPRSGPSPPHPLLSHRTPARPGEEGLTRAVMETFAEVALPIPLPDPLTYSVPTAWISQAVPGVRTRVLMGRRRLTGVIVAVHDRRPQ